MHACAKHRRETLPATRCNRIDTAHEIGTTNGRKVAIPPKRLKQFAA